MTSYEPVATLEMVAAMAGKWRPVLPEPGDTVDSEEYYSHFDLLVQELRSSAVSGNLRSTCALAGQILEFVLKVSLEASGISRRDLSGDSGSLGSLIPKAKITERKDGSGTILFNPKSVQDSDGKLDRAALDQILHRDLVQHSILQAHKYRNIAAHAIPWARPIYALQAARQMGASIAICEHLAPSFPPPASSADSSQIERLRDLRSRGIDLAVAFLPERSIKRVNEIILQLRHEEGEASSRTLIDAVARNPTWLFARTPATNLQDLRQLVQILNSSGYTFLSRTAAVVLPINDLALTYIVRRYGKGFADHTMLAKSADPALFGQLLSKTKDYPAFIDEFCAQVLGEGDKGAVTVAKADYLARGFENLPSPMRNQILMQLGEDASVTWFRSCRYGFGPAILWGISDAATASLPQLKPIRNTLRHALAQLTATSPPRFIVHSYLDFAHRQSRSFRFQLYESMLGALRLCASDADQEAASCRILMEIILAVDRRGPIFIQGQALAAVNAQSASSRAIRVAYLLLASGLDSLPDVPEEAAADALDDLSDLVEKDALVAHTVASFLLNREIQFSDELMSVLSQARDRSAYIIKSHRKTEANLIDQFLSLKGWLR